MTRIFAAAYVLATFLAWTSVPAEPMPDVNVTVVSEAGTAEAALAAAWHDADDTLDGKCRHLGTHGAEAGVGTEQVGPTADGMFRATVYVGGTCF